MRSGTMVARPGRRDLSAIILRNTIAATFGAWTTRLAHVLFTIYAARTLGEVGLGRYATIVAFAGLFSVFSELGMAQYVERSIAQDSSRVKGLFWNLVAMRASLALVAVGGISALAFGLYDRELAFGVFLFTLTFLLAAIMVPLGIILTANERFDVATVLHLIGQAITMGLGVVLLWSGFGIYALLIPGFVAMPLQILVGVVVVKRLNLGPSRFQIDRKQWGPFVRASLPFGITSLALTLNFNVDTVILGFFRDEADVGWYNASYRMVFNVVGVVGAFLVAMTPSLAREHKHSPERVTAWVRNSIRWMIIFGLPAGAGLSLVSSDLVRLMYGESFAAAGPVAAIIAWDIPLFILLSFFGNVSAATERERSAARIYVGSAAANVVLNLVFIPFYGMYAAAVVTVVSDLITCLLFFVLLREMIAFHPRFTSTVLRTACATVLMSAVLLAFAQLPLLPSIALGGLVYLLSAVALRLIDVPAVLAGVRRMARRIRLQGSST